MHRGNLNAYLQLAGGTIAFGSAMPVSKIVATAFPVFLASTMRATLAVILLAVLAYPHRGGLNGMTRRDWWYTALIAATGIFGVSILSLYGMRLVSGIIGSAVISTSPAVTALASFMFLGERVGWRKFTAIALAVIGVLVIELGGKSMPAGAATSSAVLGSLMVFGVVCADAAYTLLGKVVMRDLAPVLLAAISTALAIPMFLPFAVREIGEFRLGRATAGDWVALAWYGVGSLAMGSVLYDRGVAQVPASVAAGFIGLMPISGLVLSYLLLDEPFRWIHIPGFALILLGVAMIAWAHARRERARGKRADSSPRSRSARQAEGRSNA